MKPKRTIVCSGLAGSGRGRVYGSFDVTIPMREVGVTAGALGRWVLEAGERGEEIPEPLRVLMLELARSAGWKGVD
jgi:hypothetical protein